MEEFRILLIDDDNDQEDLLREAIDIINENISDFKVVGEVVSNIDEAMVLLYKDEFHAIILDLSLSEADAGVTEDEKLTGNILFKYIKNKEIIPIAIRTGTPERVSSEANNKIIKVYARDSVLIDIIRTLIDQYKNIYDLFGTRGDINQNIQKFFWEIIPECYMDKMDDIGSLNSENKKKLLIRYTSSWLANKYMFKDSDLGVEPIEMYMFPNPIEELCSCDIIKNKSTQELYILLTPACDLANRKVEKVLLCKIKKYEAIQEFCEAMEAYKNNPKKIKNLSKWFRNGASGSAKYHFLPKVSFFEGGFVDFNSILCIEYDRETGKLNNSDYEKIGVITESFKKDIIARFSSYYHRQGQPEFKSDSVLKNLLNN